MAAWFAQIPAHIRKHGAKKAQWYAIWDEPGGSRRKKACGAGTEGKRLAKEKADLVRSEIIKGTYESDLQQRTTWAEFLKKYIEVKLSRLQPRSAGESQTSLSHFSRILKLADRPMTAITTQQLDNFLSKRRGEAGRKPKSKVSPATVNKDLRNVKTALRVAVDWGMLRKMPKISFEREPEKLPTYVTPEDFTTIYGACSAATLPSECPGGAKLWWQALLVFGQMTGWRIGEILALKWSDVDLQKCTAVTRHADNKGKRDEVVPLHPFVVEHLQNIRAFHPNVFPWEHHRRTLDDEFAAIQDAAGINLPCPDTGKRGTFHQKSGRLEGGKYAEGDVHQCTGACHRYSFHDERRSFATLNAGLPPMTLQKLMRHRHHSTTARYINMAAQLHPAVAMLHVPSVGRSGQTG